MGPASMAKRSTTWLLSKASTPVTETRKRWLSNPTNHGASGPHIDGWFSSVMKSPEFYAYHASPNEEGQRSYFYNIDLQGRLFLEETLPKNIATSIKDEKFLNFFFRRLRVNTSAKEWSVDYPYVSTCGKFEANYIRPAACPIVFHTLQFGGGDCRSNGHESVLYYAGSLKTSFSPNRLAVSRYSGRLYHEASEGYGLVRSSIAVRLADYLSVDDTDHWLYKDTIIPWLPLEYEAGPWGLPSEQLGDGL